MEKTRKKNSCVVLLSGGMDSTTLLFYVRDKLKIRQIHALSFFYGQKHSRELKMARWQAKKAGVFVHRIVDIGMLEDLIGEYSVLLRSGKKVPALRDIDVKNRYQPPTYVPNRNLIFLSLAAAYAEAHGIDDIYYGAQAQDSYGYWDCTADFVNKLNDVLKLNRKRKIKIYAPFAGWSKRKIAVLGYSLRVDYSRTWSCYRGRGEPCGICPSCVERNAAMSGME